MLQVLLLVGICLLVYWNYPLFLIHNQRNLKQTIDMFSSCFLLAFIALFVCYKLLP